MPRNARLVPIVKGRGREVPVVVPPVYNVGEFGEDLTLLFPPNLDNSGIPAGSNRRMLTPDGSAMGGTTLEILGTAASPATFAETFDYPIDMPAFCFLLGGTILGRVVVGAGNTVTFACRLLITSRATGQSLYDETVTLAGLTADSTIVFYMPNKGLGALLKQHDTLRIGLTFTGTRTAGASNVQVGLRQVQADSMLSHIIAHLHASLDHAQLVYGAQKAS